MGAAAPIIRGDEVGERPWVAGGGAWIMKPTAEGTGGASALLEDRPMQG